MKFINKRGSEIEFSEKFNIVNKASSPFKEIVAKKPINDVSISADETIAFDNIFFLQVNVANAGSITFLFNKEKFDKDGVVGTISLLKEYPSATVEDVANKVRSLYEIAILYHPLLSIYNPLGDLVIDESRFQTLCGDISTFYLSDKGEIYGFSFSKKTKSSATFFGGFKKRGSDNKEEEKQNVKSKNPFTIIAEEKFHFLFAFIATFLIGFTISVGIYDCYLGKMILIFFFICALAGTILNAFIYYDTLKDHYFNELYTILTFVMNLLGVGLSIGGYLLFMNLSKDKPTQNPNILLMILIILGATAISIAGSYLICKIKKKKMR